MKYKAGDRVKIKSLDWYNENKDEYGDVNFFIKEMSEFCGEIMTIKHISGIYYIMEESAIAYAWTDEMIEGLVEEEIEKKLSDESWRYKNIFDPAQYPQSFECPKGYQFVDDNGNIINATKIVLEKKKKEYPKTLGECRAILGIMSEYGVFNYKANLITTFMSLLICRDAYWKLYGEEMGLGRPWEPDWTSFEGMPAIFRFRYNIVCDSIKNQHCLLVFPTIEMRNAFYENFKKLIEQCKELL